MMQALPAGAVSFDPFSSAQPASHGARPSGSAEGTNMKAPLSSCASALALIAVQASAQEVIDLDAITVTANRSETALARSGSTVEVVTREELDEAGDVLVADYLASLPGITLSANGGIGAQSTLRIRGAGGAYISVLVDGIEVNDPSGIQSAFDFGRLTTADVGRIEVLKGSQSALYGSDAIAGVINITTNRATEPGLTQSYNAEYGSYDTKRLSYNLSWRDERGSFAMTAARIQTDGFSSADENDGNTEADGHDGRRLTFSGDYRLTDTLTIGGAAFVERTRTEYDDAGPVDGTPDDVVEAASRGARAFLRQETESGSHEISVQHYWIDRKNSGTSAFGPFLYPYTGARRSVAYAGQSFLSPDLTLSYGADYTRESYENDGNSGEYDTTGLYAEADWAAMSDLNLVLSLRHDEHSEFGGATTGRLALAWRPRSDVTLRFSAGTGFRAPSLYELYDSFSGNPALDPETSVSYELGVEKRFGEDGFIRATAFRTKVTDLIQYVYDPSTFSGGYVQVPGESTRDGVELSGGWTLGEGIRLVASYTYTEAEDASGARLVRVPRNDLELRLSADVTDRFATDLSVRRVTDTVDTGGVLPDYTLVGLNMSYAVNDTTEAYLRVENLFDEQYQTATGYGTSDRAFYFGIRGSF
ncbi:TonB-dependent receptor [Aquicoccus sp. SCR17]|nr:TonB-dependent receptor [Carideicomes alvinocaridis]